MHVHLRKRSGRQQGKGKKNCQCDLFPLSDPPSIKSFSSLVALPAPMAISTLSEEISCADDGGTSLRRGYDHRMKRVLLSWSSGKDCAWALHLLRQQADIQVVGLVTTLNTEFQRVAMHGTRRAVLEAQAAAAQLPLWIVPLPWPCSNEIYELRMAEVCDRAIQEKIDAFAFGDLFLREIRAYRETQLKPTGLELLFPLWDIPTGQLARDMIAGGLRAKLVCVDSRQLAASFAGRDFDASLQCDLPAGVDPCGENGEFHSCVYDGPMFTAPVQLEAGEIVNRDGFVYADFQIEAARLVQV
jgi:uncharacterized protein (TIGR00290 family)